MPKSPYRNIARFFRPRGVRIKLLLSFIGLVLFTTLIMFWLATNSTQDIVYRHMAKNLTFLAIHFSYQINHEMNECITELKRVAIEGNAPSPVQFCRNIMETSIYDEHGNLITSTYPAAETKIMAGKIHSHSTQNLIAPASFVKKAISKNSPIVEIQTSDTSTPNLWIAVPVKNKAEKLRAVAVGKIPVNKFSWGTLYGNPILKGEEVHILLTNRTGYSFSLYDEKRIQIIPVKSDKLNYPVIRMPKKQEYPDRLVFRINGEKYLGRAYSIAMLPDWKLLVYQPYRRISAEVHGVGKRITLVALLALALAVILGFYRAHRVVTPITKLLNATDEISEGNYSQRVAVDSRDEIGKFAFAFNRMTASLEEKIKELKESQTHLEEAYNQLKTDSVKREETTRELHRKVEELVSLSELTRTVTTTNPEKVFETIRDIINRVMEFDTCSIKLYDSKTSVLRLQIASGLGEEYLSKNDTPITEGISGLALKMCQPIAVEDLDTDTRIPHDHVLRHMGIKSMISVPLITKQGPVGVMNLYTRYHHTFTEDEKRLLDIFANQAASAIESSRLFESLRESYLNTIRALSTAIDAKDQYTHGHSKRVSEISLIVGEQMGLSKKELELLQYAGDLHDLGKIGISEVIISKEGKLTPEEYEIMKTHPLVGETIIEPVPFLQEIRSVVRCHHEHYNGYGYPDGLKGDEIPFLSRILHIADAYDAMTSDRPYRRSLSHEMAIREIKKHSGNQFDPEAVEAFLAVLEYKTPEQVLWERETEGRKPA